jgi:hypothetical protein
MVSADSPGAGYEMGGLAEDWDKKNPFTTAQMDNILSEEHKYPRVLAVFGVLSQVVEKFVFSKFELFPLDRLLLGLNWVVQTVAISTGMVEHEKHLC